MMLFFQALSSSQDIPVYTGSHLIIFVGESNSGGYALNSDATTLELSSRPKVQIWRNLTNDGFENLKISNPDSNNMLGHTGFAETNIGIVHGWELELANHFTNNDLPTAYLIKCGQGGSNIAQWLSESTFRGIYPWDKLIERVDAGILELENLGINYQISVFFSLGINDAIAGTNADIWKTKTETLISNIRTRYGSEIKFFATNIMRTSANLIAIDDKISEIAANDSNVIAIQTSDATIRNEYHWDYEGMKLISSRMISNL